MFHRHHHRAQPVVQPHHCWTFTALRQLQRVCAMMSSRRSCNLQRPPCERILRLHLRSLMTSLHLGPSNWLCLGSFHHRLHPRPLPSGSTGFPRPTGSPLDSCHTASATDLRVFRFAPTLQLQWVSSVPSVSPPSLPQSLDALAPLCHRCTKVTRTCDDIQLHRPSMCSC